MPAKNKPNAYVVYAQSIRQQLIREGCTINGMPDLIAAARPHWEGLSAEDKDFYKRLAKERQGNYGSRQSRPNRKDNTGEVIADRFDVDEARRIRHRRERLEVNRQFPPGRDVIYKKFYFISFTIMLDMRHLNGLDDEEKIIPCEVSILEYSLDKGIERVAHKFINPGPLPLGFKATAICKSDSSHRIPIEGLGDANETYHKIYNDLCSFVMVGKKVVPPVFCKASDVEQTELALKWLSANARTQPVLKKVYDLEGLLLGLESHLIGKQHDFTPDTKATSYLNKSVYDYEKNTRCSYHDELDVRFCSSGMVIKWGYLFSDFLCPKADVPITPNHLPRDDSQYEQLYVNDNPQPSQNQHSVSHRQLQPQCEGQEEVFQPQRTMMTSHENEPSSLTDMRASMKSGGDSSRKKLPLIGRGRGLAQVLAQQRRPGEKAKEPIKLEAGRGRATIIGNKSGSRYSHMGTGMSPLRVALDDASLNELEEGPSARPKNYEAGVKGGVGL